MDITEKQQMLESALAELSRFRTMQCGQMHENVVFIETVGKEIYDKGHEDHPGWKIKIKGLCSKEIRNKTLGCAHSMVLVQYNYQLKELTSRNVVAEEMIPLQKINDIVTEIYTLDHQKGHKEKELAVAKEGLPETEQSVKEIIELLSEFRNQHIQLVEQLESTHQQVLLVLREMLERNHPKSLSSIV